MSAQARWTNAHFAYPHLAPLFFCTQHLETSFMGGLPGCGLPGLEQGALKLQVFLDYTGPPQ